MCVSKVCIDFLKFLSIMKKEKILIDNFVSILSKCSVFLREAHRIMAYKYRIDKVIFFQLVILYITMYKNYDVNRDNEKMNSGSLRLE